MHAARIAATLIALWFPVSPAVAQGDARQRLEALEEGTPAEQVKAAESLGAEFAAQATTVLVKHLSGPDAAVRLAAANALWNLAGRSADAYAAARPALEAALDDPDGAVAMHAAGALAAMKVPAEKMMPARKRVLQQGHPQPYVMFLAARGLIGTEPGPVLLPPILAYTDQVTAAQKRGGSRNNVELASRALDRLVDTQDRTLVAPMVEHLGRTKTSQAVLMRAIHRFAPRPDGWTDTLLTYVDSPERDATWAAWDLLGGQQDPASIARWTPRAAATLAVADRRDYVLSALRNAAGKAAAGLAEMAALAANPSVPEEQRLRSLEVLGHATDETIEGRVPEVTREALARLLAVCEPVLASGRNDKFLEGCLRPMPFAYRDRKVLAAQLAKWLAANPDPEVKVMYLERLEGLWSDAFDATDAVRANLASNDPRVRRAAEKALDRIRPAWRESQARQERQAAAPAPKAPPAPAGSGPGADGMALYAAMRVGDVAQVKKLVNRANVGRPVRFPQMTNPPLPLVLAVNYCGIPTVTPAQLAEIVAYLVSVGADPEGKTAQGDNLFDTAKYACPPEVIKALGGQTS